VIECVPTVNAETTNCAEFDESVAEPSEVAPSMNVTAPVAVVPAGGRTVAVKVTLWSKAEGFALELMVVVVDP
jgi:hypothetical protein